MQTSPPRRLGLALGLGFVLVLLAGASFAGYRAATEPVTPLTLLWIIVLLVSLPLCAAILYRLYGLLTARYYVDRERFALRWGSAWDELPLSAVTAMRPLTEGTFETHPPPGLWWPGCVVGERLRSELGSVEYFATRVETMMAVTAGERHFVISPPDPEAFYRAFVDASRMGSLQAVKGGSYRPSLFVAELWADRLARGLVMAGALGALSLLGFLIFRIPGLPPQVPFGFNAEGSPDPLVPPARLLVLPLILGICWAVDVALGAWMYRSISPRVLAYATWTGPALVGVLVWAAVGLLLTAR
jgi:hypothetical protein